MCGGTGTPGPMDWVGFGPNFLTNWSVCIQNYYIVFKTCVFGQNFLKNWRIKYKPQKTVKIIFTSNLQLRYIHLRLLCCRANVWIGHGPAENAEKFAGRAGQVNLYCNKSTFLHGKIVKYVEKGLKFLTIPVSDRKIRKWVRTRKN